MIFLVYDGQNCPLVNMERKASWIGKRGGDGAGRRGQVVGVVMVRDILDRW